MRRWLWLLGLFLAACGAADGGPAPTVIVSVPVEVTRLVTNTVTTTPSIIPEQTAAVPVTLVPPAPTATPVPYSGPACGLYLPLLPTADVPTTTRLNATVATDLVPELALPAFDYLVDQPEHVGLAAYVVGDETSGVFLNADTQMPLASVVKILHLVAYADAVAAGRLDPAVAVPIADLERFSLPRSDLGAYETGLAELMAADRLLDDGTSLVLGDIAWLMTRHSANNATDYLHWQLGQAAIEQTAVDLGLAGQTAPCPFVGQFLAMHNTGRSISDQAALTAYEADPTLYAADVMRLTHDYLVDPYFWLQNQNWGRGLPRVTTQAAYSAAFNTHGTARDYANLMAALLAGTVGVPRAGAIIRQQLGWPEDAFPSNQVLYSTIGYKGGSLPGILTTVYYARRASDGAGVVVALFYDDLPNRTYQQWRRELPYDELARWLLWDANAIPFMKRIVEGGA